MPYSLFNGQPFLGARIIQRAMAHKDEDDVRARLLRRFMHIAMSSCLIYYLLPGFIFGIHRVVWMLAVLLTVPITVDSIRLRRDRLYFGMREHERERFASYVWFFIGSAFLMAFFPQEVAAPLILAVAVGDVVLGETRRFRRRYAYGITYLTCTSFFVIYGYPVVDWVAPDPSALRILLTLFAGGITTIAETVELEIKWGIRDDFFRSRSKDEMSRYRRYFDLIFKFDDDFLMQVIPAIVLGMIWVVAPSLFPPPKIAPLVDTAGLLGPQRWFFEGCIPAAGATFRAWTTAGRLWLPPFSLKRSYIVDSGRSRATA